MVRMHWETTSGYETYGNGYVHGYFLNRKPPVLVNTYERFCNGPADTPLTMAMRLPFPPRDARLVTMVYNPPLLGAVLSKHRASRPYSQG